MASEHDGGVPELSNWITVLAERGHDHPVIAWLHHWENLVFAGIIAVALCLIAWRYGRRPSTVPRGGQNVLELFVEGLDNALHRIIGPTWRRHTPFIGTLFLYIWFMNLSVLIPGMKSSTSSLNTTVALALVVFGYVQWIGLTSQGPLTYLDRLAGSPRDVVGWALVPLMLPIHVLGELVRPVSLSLRLAFNILAEDMLLAVMVGLGISLGIAVHLPIGLPLQVLILPLLLIFSTVQALVFSLLSTVYIALVSSTEAHH